MLRRIGLYIISLWFATACLGQEVPFLRDRHVHKTTLALKEYLGGAQDLVDTCIIAVNEVSRFINWAVRHQINCIDVDTTYSVITAIVDRSDVEQILERPEVTFVDRIKRAKEEILVKDYDPSLNGIAYFQSHWLSNEGEGVAVSLKENNVDEADLDLVGKIIIQPPDGNMSQHATTMATVILGEGNTSEMGRGAARQAELSVSSFFNILPDAPEYFTDQKIRIQNHSYGLEVESYYGIEARSYDQFCYNHPEVLHIFSAGNMGDKVSTSGRYRELEGWANITGNMKLAKNVLTVGAVNVDLTSDPLASNGPTHDGRIKPEIVAMGQRGSSEAAATVSGACVLLQEIYEENHQRPVTSAFLKSLLATTADPIGTYPVNHKTGFGNLNLANAVTALIDYNHFQDSVSSLQTDSFTIDVPSNIHRLKVGLAWTDPAASINTGKALIHDLDLEVVDPEGNVHLPWILSTHPDSLHFPPTHGRDSLNNFELVTVDSPSAGRYQIVVNAPSLREGHQPFFVTYFLERADDFTWLGPNANQRFKSGSALPIRWQTTLDAKTASLEYRTDSGSWQSISTDIDLHQPFYFWDAPNDFAIYQLRMLTDRDTFMTSPFTVSPRPVPKVELRCADEVLVSWPAIKNATSYKVYGLRSNQMIPFFTIEDTAFVFDPKAFDSDFIAVSAIADSGAESVRSFTINWPEITATCYGANLFVQLVGDKAEIEIQLPTLYLVDQIYLQKEINNTFVDLHSFPASNYHLNYLDTPLTQGPNTYRVKTVLESGLEIFSSTQSIIAAGRNDVLLYPNPVSSAHEIRVVTNSDKDALFHIFSTSGVLMQQNNVSQGSSIIPVYDLSPGVYFYKLREENGTLYQGTFSIY